ncbi:receptor-like serine/threonine-protein kinase ALE2 isoform X4 [Rosa chinensis]|uniref:receptor-like serine/threonine-protein kinase ALE2 isoform X4 n=1 Tax=Rosa chinensis TaxID=74649 RepID=UPI000D093D10|nr:receptor-like serine/threonine-protein kinase ALE2 isoform X4 [Rosa chinensis]
MGMVMPAFLQLVNLCLIGFALALQGSTGLNPSPSPESLSVNPPIETAPGPLPQSKSFGSNVPGPALQPNGSDLHPVPAMPPLMPLPVPPKIEGQVPSLSPSTPAVLPPQNTAPPPLDVQTHAPSVLPTVPPKKTPVNNGPISMPVAPVPTPPRNVPPISPVLNSSTPETSPSSSHQGNVPVNEVPIPEPNAPQNTAPPPLDVQTHAPSVPPTVPPKKTPVNNGPISVPVAPVATPRRNLPPISPVLNSSTPETSPVLNSSTPETSPSISHQGNVPVNKVPIPETNAPAPVSSLPRASGPNPSVVHSTTPSTAPTTLPIPVASPSTLPQNPPSSHPVTPGESPSTIPDPEVSPVSSPPPNINQKKDGNSVVAPPYEAPKPSLPMGHAPAIAPSVNKPVVSSPTPKSNWKRAKMPVVAPPIEAPKPSLPTSHTPAEAPSVPKPVVSSPTPSINRKRGQIPVVAPPYEAPKSSTPTAHTPAKAPSVRKPVVSSPSPSIHWKRGGIPVVAPPYEAPKPSLPMSRAPAQAPFVHKPLRHYKLAPGPSDSFPEPPSDKGSRSPASSPPSSLYKYHHTRNNITNPTAAPSYLASPSTSKQQGPVIAPASVQTRRRRHYASPPLYPGSSAPPSHLPVTPSASHVSPAPSPSLKDASDYTKIPPIRSAPGSLSTSPKMPPLPQVHALPPPPPNADCLVGTCSDPYTNTPPGSPCICVLPMQVGLRLSVPLYTFFPLVSELAQEIAVGVFMQQSQVRIIGANAASQNPEKTVVLIDLVPLGEKFDSTTAFLTDQRFWHRQVVIKASYFGDYEVLYVRYPGLPPSPPSSDADVINAGPYPGNDNNARAVKPFGVNVSKRRHKSGLNGGIIAIIALSSFVVIALCSAAAWVFLFKPRDRASQLSSTPRTLLPSIGKRSVTVGSMRDSRHSSASLSFGSSIATYTGSANTFSASDIAKATNNLDPSRILGEGGFGLVYSGDLEDGTKVAVKVLKRDDQQGGREFLAEVEMLSRLHHRNLVKLIGICVEEHRCLVYELIPNGSVESHLHGIDKETAPLSWGPRMKIALGAARGLAYLHEDSSPRVIHRDFKSSNILLENDFTPKVSDFGLARTALDEENRHISTRVMGTFGYVAPEYAMTGHLLVKSDVYSYGVVLLELLSGRKPVDMSQPPGEENLVAWARPLLTSREGLEALVDKNLGSDVPFDSIAKVAAIASMCVQPEVSHRPFMGEVVQALKLVCNEFDESKEIGSRSSSREDLSMDMAAGASTISEQMPYPFQRQYSAPTYDSDLETEREATLLKLYSTSMRTGREDSESFRRHSSSGPLGTGRSKQFWQKLRSSGGSVSEHGFMLKLWQGSH